MVVAMVAAVTISQATAAAQTTEPVRDSQANLVVTDVEFEPSDDLARWFGAGVDGVVTIVVENTGDTRAKGSPGTVDADGRTALLPSVKIKPGDQARVSTELTLTGASPRERDIVINIGAEPVTITHQTIPWGLVAIAAVALHLVLLAVRDQLRAAVKRGVDADPRRYATRRQRAWLAREP